MPKICDYNRDKMVIKQNEVVWNQKHQKHRGMIFAMQCISLSKRKFRYDSEISLSYRKKQGIAKFKFSLCTVIFAMIANFRYDNEISLA